MIRVLLADDHALFRTGIRQILSLEPDLEVVAEVADGEALLAELPAARPDVIVLDLAMPRMGGIETLRRIVEEDVPVAVVVLSMYPPGPFAMHLIHQGAGAYLTKDDSPSELVRAIREVATGGDYLTERMRAQRDRPSAELVPHEQLSPREFQVFARLAEGMSVSDIAVELDVRTSTVSTLVSRIKQKLGVASVGEIVAYAHRAGVIA